MISFKDIKLTKQKNTIYIPQHLKWTLENFLKKISQILRRGLSCPGE